MASDDTTSKTEAAPAAKAAATESSATAKPTEGGATDTAAPSSYSRGEGQKPVTQNYRDNWDAIFKKGKKTKKK